MGRTGEGKIDRKLKRENCNEEYKKDSKGSKINTDLNEYVPKTLENELIKKQTFLSCC